MFVSIGSHLRIHDPGARARPLLRRRIRRRQPEGSCGPYRNPKGFLIFAPTDIAQEILPAQLMQKVIWSPRHPSKEIICVLRSMPGYRPRTKARTLRTSSVICARGAPIPATTSSRVRRPGKPAQGHGRAQAVCRALRGRCSGRSIGSAARIWCRRSITLSG